MNFDKVPELPDAPEAPRPRWQRRAPVLVVALVLLAGGFFAYRFQRDASRREARREAVVQVAGLQRELSDLAPRIATATGPERLALLRQAADLAERIGRLRPNPTAAEAEQAQVWRTRYEDAEAERRTALSLELEQEAAAKARAGDREGAVVSLRAAWEEQRYVNRSAVSPTAKNIAREARLEQDYTEQAAAPLAAEVDAVTAAARAAAAAQRGDEARSRYAAALEARRRLNREFPRSRYADIASEEALVRELAALGESRAGSPAGAAGDHPAADDASANQAREAAAQWRRIGELADQAAQRLRRRDPAAAATLVREAAALVEDLRARLPRAPAPAGDLAERLDYLSVRGADLAALQAEAYGHLLPLPGNGAVSLWRQEISQEIFTRVMGRNPSVNAGRSLPVDSVTWDEAREFCRRLGWILGTVVRLPREEESRAALGRVEPARLADEAWHAGNSANRSRPAGHGRPNVAGFYDLLGNLAEWQNGDDRAEAAVFGGSFAQPAAVLATVPVARVPRDRRSPEIGFRVLVEIDFATPVDER